MSLKAVVEEFTERLHALIEGQAMERARAAVLNAALEAMLLGSDALTDTERKKVQRDLLEYCKRDTLPMVRLHERLLEVARRA